MATSTIDLTSHYGDYSNTKDFKTFIKDNKDFLGLPNITMAEIDDEVEKFKRYLTGFESKEQAKNIAKAESIIKHYLNKKGTPDKPKHNQKDFDLIVAKTKSLTSDICKKCLLADEAKELGSSIESIVAILDPKNVKAIRSRLRTVRAKSVKVNFSYQYDRYWILFLLNFLDGVFVYTAEFYQRIQQVKNKKTEQVQTKLQKDLDELNNKGMIDSVKESMGLTSKDSFKSPKTLTKLVTNSKNTLKAKIGIRADEGITSKSARRKIGSFALGGLLHAAGAILDAPAMNMAAGSFMDSRRKKIEKENEFLEKSRENLQKINDENLKERNRTNDLIRSLNRTESDAEIEKINGSNQRTDGISKMFSKSSTLNASGETVQNAASNKVKDKLLIAKKIKSISTSISPPHIMAAGGWNFTAGEKSDNPELVEVDGKSPKIVKTSTSFNANPLKTRITPLGNPGKTRIKDKSGKTTIKAAGGWNFAKGLASKAGNMVGSAQKGFNKTKDFIGGVKNNISNKVGEVKDAFSSAKALKIGESTNKEGKEQNKELDRIREGQGKAAEEASDYYKSEEKRHQDEKLSKQNYIKNQETKQTPQKEEPKKEDKPGMLAKVATGAAQKALTKGLSKIPVIGGMIGGLAAEANADMKVYVTNYEEIGQAAKSSGLDLPKTSLMQYAPIAAGAVTAAIAGYVANKTGGSLLNLDDEKAKATGEDKELQYKARKGLNATNTAVAMGSTGLQTIAGFSAAGAANAAAGGTGLLAKMAPAAGGFMSKAAPMAGTAGKVLGKLATPLAGIMGAIGEWNKDENKGLSKTEKAGKSTLTGAGAMAGAWAGGALGGAALGAISGGLLAPLGVALGSAAGSWLGGKGASKLGGWLLGSDDGKGNKKKGALSSGIDFMMGEKDEKGERKGGALKTAAIFALGPIAWATDYFVNKDSSMIGKAITGVKSLIGSVGNFFKTDENGEKSSLATAAIFALGPIGWAIDYFVNKDSSMIGKAITTVKGYIANVKNFLFGDDKNSEDKGFLSTENLSKMGPIGWAIDYFVNKDSSMIGKAFSAFGEKIKSFTKFIPDWLKKKLGFGGDETTPNPAQAASPQANVDNSGQPAKKEGALFSAGKSLVDKVKNYGAHANGTNFVTNGPGVMLVGEKGKEQVTVTPLNNIEDVGDGFAVGDELEAAKPNKGGVATPSIGEDVGDGFAVTDETLRDIAKVMRNPIITAAMLAPMGLTPSLAKKAGEELKKDLANKEDSEEYEDKVETVGQFDNAELNKPTPTLTDKIKSWLGFSPPNTPPSPQTTVPVPGNTPSGPAPKVTSKQAKEHEEMMINEAKKAGITDPKELATFMGQVSHESGGFKYLKELGSGAKYEGRTTLGNTQQGDGERYKGRGFIQLTGRANYRKYGKIIGVDLENNPELAEKPEIASKLAIAYWQNTKGLSDAGKRGDVTGATKRVNGGYNGLQDRVNRTAGYASDARMTSGITPATGGSTGGSTPVPATANASVSPVVSMPPSSGGGVGDVGGGAPSGGGSSPQANAGLAPVQGSGGMSTIQTKSGRKATVASKFAPNFQGFINDLEATGYKIDSLGGFADRNMVGGTKKSYHAFGAAIDINPSRNPFYKNNGGPLKTDMPANTGQLAAKWGLGWGGNWNSIKDAMHFSVAKGEGGSVPMSRDSSMVDNLGGASPKPIGNSGPGVVGDAGGGSSTPVKSTPTPAGITPAPAPQMASSHNSNSKPEAISKISVQDTGSANVNPNSTSNLVADTKTASSKSPAIEFQAEANKNTKSTQVEPKQDSIININNSNGTQQGEGLMKILTGDNQSFASILMKKYAWG